MRRLRESRDSFDARSLATARPNDETGTIGTMGDEEAGSALILGRRGTTNTWLGSRGSRNGIVRYAFENVLQKSWVYRRNGHRTECDASFVTTDQRSHAWSVFTGYSLDDISILSVIAMPITGADLENGQYYDTGTAVENAVQSEVGESVSRDSEPSPVAIVVAERLAQVSAVRSPRAANPGSRWRREGTRRAPPRPRLVVMGRTQRPTDINPRWQAGYD
jgi:hypothetical protein